MTTEIIDTLGSRELLGFIINYDIKYCMDKELEGDEEQ
jgi:hypothetical protein